MKVEMENLEKEIVNKKPKNKKKRIVIISIVLAVLFLFCIINNNILVVSEYEYKGDKIPEAFDGFTIVQISDLHNKEYPFDQAYLMNKIEDSNPDIIVITGDIVDSSHMDMDGALEFARKCVELAPTYYITGNHEYWISKTDLEELISSLEEIGVICLEDECVSVKQGDANINLIGLDEKSLADETLKNMMLDIGTEDFNILLAHEPQYIDDYARSGVDLVLSGHAHGGQVRLPFVGGMYAPDQGFMPSYTEGEYTVGNTTMIVSRGIGNSVIPLRVFNLPEIVVIKLKSN